MRSKNQILCEVRRLVAEGQDQPGEIYRLLRNDHWLDGHERVRSELEKQVTAIAEQYKAEIAPFPFQVAMSTWRRRVETVLADVVQYVLEAPVPDALGPRERLEVESALRALFESASNEPSVRNAFDTLAEAGYDLTAARATYDELYPPQKDDE